MSAVSDPLGFSDQWYSLELITKEQYQEFLKEFREGIDPNAEHYRWRAFDDYLGRNKSLPDDLMRKLYHLGEMDSDHSMGSSMMFAIIERQECPRDLLLEAARNTNREALQKKAKSRI